MSISPVPCHVPLRVQVVSNPTGDFKTCLVSLLWPYKKLERFPNAPQKGPCFKVGVQGSRR